MEMKYQNLDFTRQNGNLREFNKQQLKLSQPTQGFNHPEVEFNNPQVVVSLDYFPWKI